MGVACNKRHITSKRIHVTWPNFAETHTHTHTFIGHDLHRPLCFCPTPFHNSSTICCRLLVAAIANVQLLFACCTMSCCSRCIKVGHVSCYEKVSCFHHFNNFQYFICAFLFEACPVVRLHVVCCFWIVWFIMVFILAQLLSFIVIYLVICLLSFYFSHAKQNMMKITQNKDAITIPIKAFNLNV